MCFFGGIATSAVGLVEVVRMLLDFDILFDPFFCVLSCYVLLFGLTSVLLECDAEKLDKMPVVGRITTR